MLDPAETTTVSEAVENGTAAFCEVLRDVSRQAEETVSYLTRERPANDVPNASVHIQNLIALNTEVLHGAAKLWSIAANNTALLGSKIQRHGHSISADVTGGEKPPAGEYWCFRVAEATNRFAQEERIRAKIVLDSPDQSEHAPLCPKGWSGPLRPDAESDERRGRFEFFFPESFAAVGVDVVVEVAKLRPDGSLIEVDPQPSRDIRVTKGIG